MSDRLSLDSLLRNSLRPAHCHNTSRWRGDAGLVATSSDLATPNPISR
jgi:hypothetical protein